MNDVQKRIQEVQTARLLFINTIAGIPEATAQWKPAPEVWSVIEITEHLFWAEQGGIYGMWKTLQAIRDGSLERNYASPHQNLSIEEIIEMTWQPKEKVPAVAAPRLGGTLAFWKASLQSLQAVLDAFGQDLQDDELRLQAHPHPISGALNFQQRIEFLRFHMDRHRLQASQLIATMN